VTRELSFFPGAAIGPVLAAYDYQSISGSRIAKIRWESDAISPPIYNAFFNGGCCFKDADQYPNTQVIACYADAGFEERAAIIECKIAKGKAILCGVHPEYNIADLYASLTSEEDRNHFKRHILTGLSDLSHKLLFSAIIYRIR
jgi:biotin--protein ligase